VIPQAVKVCGDAEGNHGTNQLDPESMSDWRSSLPLELIVAV
jgi:hypothetical protein